MEKNKDLKFEDAMLVLENSIGKLEAGALTLDESIEEFEKALEYIKICEKKLSSARERVRILTEAEDGTVTDAPFSEE